MYLIYCIIPPIGKSRNHIIDWILFPAVVLAYSVATFFLVKKKLKIAIFAMSSFSFAVFFLQVTTIINLKIYFFTLIVVIVGIIIGPFLTYKYPD